MDRKLYINEQLLIDLLYANNRQAFSFVHDTFSPDLHGSLIDLIETDKACIGAVLENGFASVWQALQSCDERQQKLFAWLLHMMQQLAIVALQQLNRCPSADKLECISIGLHQSLLAMHQTQRRVIELTYNEGYTRTQVAEALAIPVETVDKLLRSGLNQLRFCLRAFYKTIPDGNPNCPF